MLYAPKSVYNKMVPATETHFGIPFAAIVDPATMLLHFNGVNGSTTFIDSSVQHQPTVAGGTATIDTSQSVFGGSSVQMDAAVTGFVTVADNWMNAPGPGDFTADCRFRRRATGVQNNILYGHNDFGTEWVVYISSVDDTIRFDSNGADRIIGPALATLTWYHIAVARASGTTQLFVNGTSVGTPYADPASYLTLKVMVGSDFGGADGWVDEARYIVGRAIWTANFTPPTSPYRPPPPY